METMGRHPRRTRPPAPGPLFQRVPDEPATHEDGQELAHQDQGQPQVAQERFGHMLEAFEFGTPPHGGIAPGIDRVCMILADEPNIREVIAFPKNQVARDVMADAPSPVEPQQLKELHIKVVE